MFRFQLSLPQALYNEIQYTDTHTQNVQNLCSGYWRPVVSNGYSMVSVSAYDTQQDETHSVHTVHAETV